LLIMGAKNHAHATGPDLFDQAVMSKNVADAGGWHRNLSRILGR